MIISSKNGQNAGQRQRLAAHFSSAIAASIATLFLLLSALATSPPVYAAEQLQDHASIYKAISLYVKEATGKQASITPLNVHQRIDKCQLPLQVDFPFNNHKTVRVQCTKTYSQKTPSWKLHLKVKLNQSLLVWRSTKQLEGGHLIKASDIVLATYQGNDFGQLLNKDLSPVGRYTKQRVIKDKWLQKSDLSDSIRAWETKALIKAGTVLTSSMLQPVTINKRQASISLITTRADIVGKVSRYNLAAGRAITKQDISVRTQVWVAIKNLPSGRTIVADDLSLEWRLEHQLRQPGFSDIKHIVGQVPKSYITKGRVITANLLRIAYLVHKGSVVRLTKTTSSLSISSKATALSNGNKGDTVKVKVLGSGKLREGIVIAKGVLELVE